MYLLLLTGTALAWTWALVAFGHQPVLLGTCLLAYTLGLRHALDADHIAAIDNVQRKLMQAGQRPVAVGLYFSLGHSTVVVLACLAIAWVAVSLQGRFAALREVAVVVGTGVSALFLFAIAAANVLILVSVYRLFQRARRGAPVPAEHLDLALANPGLLGRRFRRLFGLMGASWHMYPLGLLFGLGFDTATQIGLLGISAAGVGRDLSLWSILVFPALFTAGMTLVDSTDSVLMLGAYGWAFAQPLRKLYYNLTVTLVSVVIAVLVGALETLSLLASRLGLQGPFWRTIGALTDNAQILGYLVVGVFVLAWILSVAIYRLRRLDQVRLAGD
ncbi:MAG TPA: HoxN/HupN/NixA family nickel/cobalt transporter [bacterium]|nr:HoxN/HupN/NixA family nickel/cobalt transporter [bacterium]